MRRFGQAVRRPGWSWDVGVRGRPHCLGNISPVLHGRAGLEDFFGWMRANFDPSVTWRDLEWVRAQWQGTLIIKGIMESDDAAKAVDLGADGLVVSNHGGRQLDGAMSVAQSLPAIAKRVGNRTVLLADGGVRSGVDIVRMIALGASAVLIGRPWAFALAGRGQAGVAHMLALFESEMRVTMALAGLADIAQIDASILARTALRD
ncbi:MAG: hypothetical protein CFE32_20340 [Alphaproteobacteria bacterium PA3]|nr:MAG: hypothetical protein CFE32_20340 [Alphaproteobacteria bacterium PA3]